jgi:hypothetical protein
MAEFTSGQHARLGDAVLAAQAAYAEEGVMPELLADPGLRLRPRGAVDGRPAASIME